MIFDEILRWRKIKRELFGDFWAVKNKRRRMNERVECVRYRVVIESDKG